MAVSITLDEDMISPERQSGDFRHLSDLVPKHYSEPPTAFPAEIGLGYRALAPFARIYLKAYMDPIFRENCPVQWACYLVALGKLCDHHRKTMTCKAMMNEISTKKELALIMFIQDWDSIAGPIPGVK